MLEITSLLNILINDPIKLVSISAFLSFIILQIPIVGNFFRSVNTLVHESGHAITALLTSGEVVSVDLKSDTSGVAVTKSSNSFSKFLVSIAGYPFASAVAFLMFYFFKHKNYDWVLYLILSFSLINLMFWVRNLYGIIWLIILISLIGIQLYYQNPKLIMIFSVFFTCILLIESIRTSIVVFYLSLTDHKKSGDAKNLKELTYLPAFLWGALFFSQSVYAAYSAVLLFLN